MFNVPSFFGFRGGGEFIPDVDYQAVLDYASTLPGVALPSASQQLLQNQLLVDLKSAGIWSKLDTFAVFATDGDSDFALIDWKRLSQYTAVNSPAFTTNEGFKGDGVAAYVNTNFIASIDSVNYQQDDASRSFYVWFDGANRYDGTLLTPRSNQLIKGASTTQFINSTNNISPNYTMTNIGFKSIHRTSSTNIALYQDTTGDTRTQTSTGLATSEQTIFTQDSIEGTHGISFYAMGSNLVSENTDFVNSWNNYYTAL